MALRPRRKARGIRWRLLAIGVSALLVTTALVLVPGTGDSANAYSLTGCRFSSATIPYSSPTPPTSYPATASRSDWTVNTDVASFATSSATIRIAFAYGYYGATGWSGLTQYYSCAGTGGIHNNTVYLYINRTATDPYVPNARQSVISHEIGHAIGLGHVGSSTGICLPATLMNPYDSFRYFTCGIYQTRADDRNAANSLY